MCFALKAHSCVEKAAMIGFVKLRILDTDQNFTLRGSPLAKAMEEDRASGLVPFFVSATLGTTSCCSFDALNEIGPVCQREGMFHKIVLMLSFQKSNCFSQFYTLSISTQSLV